MINYDLIKNIDGWCSNEKMNKMVSLILATKPQCIVEIGVFYGKSFLCQALALKKNKFGKIYGIDSWNASDCISYMTDAVSINWWNSLNYDMIYDQFLENIRNCEVEHFTHILKGKSIDCINHIDFPIDILHIDGNHEELSSCKDVLVYIPKLKQGGFLWFNDANWHQSKKAVDLIENHFQLKLLDKAQSEDPNNYCNLYIKL